MISNIKYPDSLFKRLLVFRSISQLTLSLAYTVLSFLVLDIFFRIANIETNSLGILFGCLAGGLTMAIFFIRAAFNYSGKEVKDVKTLVMHILEIRGYIVKSHANHVIVMGSRLPWPLSWKESNCKITESGELITIDGPLLLVKSLRSRIVNDFDND